MTPCPGNDTCCNRDEFSRTIFPCSERVQVLASIAAKLRAQPAQPFLCPHCGAEVVPPLQYHETAADCEAGRGE